MDEIKESSPMVGEENTQPGSFNSTSQLGGLPPRAPEPPVQPSAYVSPAVPAEPLKQRRVGTFTLGVSLILLGVLIPCGLLFGSQAWFFLKFAPIILVFLGIEILVYAFRFKSEKLRYDGLSVFLVILLTFGTLISSAIITPVTNAMEFGRQERGIRRDIERYGEEMLAKYGYAGSVDAYNYYGGEWYLPFGGNEPEEWQMSVNFSLRSIGTADSPAREEVEKAFFNLAQELKERQEVRYASFSYEINSSVGSRWQHYYLSLNESELKVVTPEFVSARMIAEEEFSYEEEYDDSRESFDDQGESAEIYSPETFGEE